MASASDARTSQPIQRWTGRHTAALVTFFALLLIWPLPVLVLGILGASGYVAMAMFNEQQDRNERAGQARMREHAPGMPRATLQRAVRPTPRLTPSGPPRAASRQGAVGQAPGRKRRSPQQPTRAS